jgi:hypothetical protein
MADHIEVVIIDVTASSDVVDGDVAVVAAVVAAATNVDVYVVVAVAIVHNDDVVVVAAAYTATTYLRMYLLTFILGRRYLSRSRKIVCIYRCRGLPSPLSSCAKINGEELRELHRRMVH